MNTSTTRTYGPTTRVGPSADSLPTAVAVFQRPTIEQEWWSVTTVRWNEMLADASGNNKTRAVTALNTQREYHDANTIMLSNVGKDAPVGHCKQCWNKEKWSLRESVVCLLSTWMVKVLLAPFAG